MSWGDDENRENWTPEKTCYLGRALVRSISNRSSLGFNFPYPHPIPWKILNVFLCTYINVKVYVFQRVMKQQENTLILNWSLVLTLFTIPGKASQWCYDTFYYKDNSIVHYMKQDWISIIYVCTSFRRRVSYINYSDTTDKRVMLNMRHRLCNTTYKF